MVRLSFEYNNRIEMLPVNPEAVNIKRDANSSTVEIVKLGEINRINGVRLASITIASFFPTNPDYGFVLGSELHSPEHYVNFFQAIMHDRRPCRFIVTTTDINILASVELFDVEYKGGVGEIYFNMTLKEYRPHQAREVTINITPPTPVRPTPPPPRVTVTPPRPPSTNQRPTVGSRVVVNGRLHRDSFGAGPGQTEVNATRRINFTAPGRSHPYHVTLDANNGGWRGWVTATSITRVL